MIAEPVVRCGRLRHARQLREDEYPVRTAPRFRAGPDIRKGGTSVSSSGLDTFDRTLQETNLWLKRVMEISETDDRHLAYAGLKSTLHALRDRIGPENAVHLGAQLPMLIRGFYYEGWHMAGTPTKERHNEQFFDHVRAELPGGAKVDAEKMTRAVFSVMWEKVDPGEVSKLIKIFPKSMRDLWPLIAEEE
jgi:uncharacterized protein (DUF2267 family)